MESLTVHTLSALHALCHRTALTRAEQRAVTAHCVALTPELWSETTRLLAAVDATVDLVFLWFGLEPTPESTRRIAEALEGCTGALTDEEARGVRQARHFLFTERTLRIACTEPLAEADACVGALAVALDAAPHPSPDTAQACELLLALYRAHPDDARARRALERITTAHSPATEVHPHLPTAALVLSIAWCITHRAMCLPGERSLDPGIERTPESWERIRAAAMRGDADAIALPSATAAAWSVDEAPSDAQLREGLRASAPRLAETLAAVECVWAGAAPGAVCDEALRQVLCIACMRRVNLDAGYRAPEDARAHLWFDAHQSARRADTIERVALVRQLHKMFERHGDVSPRARTCLHLDRAVELEALGHNARARAELEAAVALEASVASPDSDERPSLHLAVWLWSEGDVRGARRLLRTLTEETTRNVRHTLAEYASRRKTLRLARRHATRDPCVEAGSRRVALTECAPSPGASATRSTPPDGHWRSPANARRRTLASPPCSRTSAPRVARRVPPARPSRSMRTPAKASSTTKRSPNSKTSPRPRAPPQETAMTRFSDSTAPSEHSASALASALAARAEQLCRRYLPRGRKQGRYWTVGDVHGTEGRSLYVRLSPPGTPGWWTDAATAERGDLLELLRLNLGAATLRPALDEARAFLALPASVPPAAPLRTARRDEAPRRLWQMCTAIDGSHAEAYLHARAIRACRDAALRFHPTLYYRGPDGGFATFPALVARVSGPDGAFTGIQRTYLHPRYPAKAPVPDARKALGRIHGHAVYFGPPPNATLLLVAEGVETALSRCAPPVPTCAPPQRSGRQASPRSPRPRALRASSSPATTTPPGTTPRSGCACDAAHGASTPRCSSPCTPISTTTCSTTAPQLSPSASPRPCTDEPARDARRRAASAQPVRPAPSSPNQKPPPGSASPDCCVLPTVVMLRRAGG